MKLYDDMSVEWNNAYLYEGICMEVISGKMSSFSEDEKGIFPESFTCWCRYHGLLVCVA